MDSLARHRRLFDYDRWANGEVLASLRQARRSPPSALATFAHVLAAEELWLVRLRRDHIQVAVWPDLSLEQCEHALERVALGWREYLMNRTPASLEEIVAYTNTQGERWSNRVEDVLTHVVMHSSYHRGQIASDLRRADDMPAYSDFIHAVRQGCLE